MAVNPTAARLVPVRILARFPPITPRDWNGGHQATIGKRLFLDHFPNALDADSASVSAWLQSLGYEVGSRWVEVEITPELPPRWANIGFSTRCVDAFIRLDDGHLQGAELKPTGNDGVAGLTLSEERLLRAGHLRLFHIQVLKGLIGEADPDELLAAPRRIGDGVPVGEVRIRWLEESEREEAVAPAELSVAARVVAPSVPAPGLDGSESLWRRLLEGFDYRSRPNNAVHQVKVASGVTIGEVCVGAQKTRLNFREPVIGQPDDLAVQLTGRSQSWRGGGVVVTEFNLDDCRRLIAFVVDIARLAVS